MGGHNRPYHSLRWAGMADEQNFARDTRDWRERRDLKFRKPRTSDLEPLSFSPVRQSRSSAILLALVMSCDDPTNLTPRRGLVYDAAPGSIFIVYSAKEESDVAGDALKVEDATWDAEVIKSSELVMVDFWAVWCGPCQMVAPVIEELSKEYAGKMKVRKLNTDENPEVAGRYQVMSIPTILFFKNGQVVEKLVGARPKRQFKEMIDSLLAQPAGSA